MARRARTPPRASAPSKGAPRAKPDAPGEPSAPRAPTVVDAPPRPTGSLTWGLVLVVLAATLALSAMRWRRGPSARPTSAPAGERASRAEVVDAAGPAWPGEVEAHMTELATPEAYIGLAACSITQDPWVFEGRDLEGVVALARAAGMATDQAARLRELARCGAQGCAITPDAALVESMTVETRSALYRELQRFPANTMQMFPSYRPAQLGRWSEIPGLSPRLRELLARTSWREPERDSYSDHAWLCARLPSDDARLEAIRVFYRRYTLDAWVRVPRTGDVEPMVRYWSRGGSADEVRRTLLRARSGDGRVPVGALLPAFARARLGRFPSPDDPEYDCFWTSLHFFDDVDAPDDRPGHEGMAALLRTAYREIPASEVRLGDVMAQFTHDGSIVHAANLVTRDLAFTKNGRDHTRPWALQSLALVRSGYPFTQIRYFRRR